MVSKGVHNETVDYKDYIVKKKKNVLGKLWVVDMDYRIFLLSIKKCLTMSK